ncbi:mechanosensitive ion channel family protein [Haloferula chungangensis]|uniref:Mechanosensitive ion channel family protein n=1 Tax=Haloferula chungangensis TaxID=1048331 RepID=A0ABW2L995_9BACT
MTSHAAEPPAGEPPAAEKSATEEPAAQTTNDPSISPEHLALRLDPLTKAELEVEAEAWQEILKAKASEVAAAEIAVRSDPSPEEKDALLKSISALQKEKDALIDRFEIVADAYEVKGGDPDPFKKYAAAVGGIKTDVTDVSSTWFYVTDWLQSKDGGIKVAIDILVFLGVMLGFWILARLISRLVKNFLSRTARMSRLLVNFINKIVGRVILLIGLIVALGVAGVNVGAALAMIGGGAFILAFALQDTLGNFANGLMLLVYRPFDVGDAVEIGGVTGSVHEVSLVNTTILTFDNKKVIVPNKNVWGQVITNITGMPTRRVDMTFGIGYDDDTDLALAILHKVVKEHELILQDPAPSIRIDALADSSVNFICRPWSKTSDYWTVYAEITDRVKKEFDAAGISIPYPQTDVHLHTVDKVIPSST